MHSTVCPSKPNQHTCVQTLRCCAGTWEGGHTGRAGAVTEKATMSPACATCTSSPLTSSSLISVVRPPGMKDTVCTHLMQLYTGMGAHSQCSSTTCMRGCGCKDDRAKSAGIVKAVRSARAEYQSAASQPNAHTLQRKNWHCQQHGNHRVMGMSTTAARAHGVDMEGAILDAAAQDESRRRLIC